MPEFGDVLIGRSCEFGSAIRLVKLALSLPGASRVARPMIWMISVRLER